MSDRDDGSIIFSFLIGGVIGAILGLLFAPQSGRITRAKIADVMDDLGEKGKGLVEKGKDLAEKGEEFIERQKNRFAKPKTEEA